MLTIHGQHESYELLDKEQHRVYVDAQGQLDGLVAEYRQVYAQLRAAQKNMDALLTNEEEKTRRADLLTYEIEELEKGAITPGEQEKLQQQRILFRNGEKTATQFLRCREALQGGDEPGAVDLLQQAADAAEEAAQYLPQAQKWAEQLRGPITMYSPWPMKKRVLRDSWILTRRKRERVEARLDELYRLGLKYGRTEEEMLRYLENAKKELHAIELADEELAKWQQVFETQKAKAIELARELSHRRRDAARELTRRVAEELAFSSDAGRLFSGGAGPLPLKRKRVRPHPVPHFHQPRGRPETAVENCIRRGIIPHYAGA